MLDITTEESNLAAASEVTGAGTVDAFERLANRTRLAILLALWEAYEPFEGAAPVRFSALRERVGVCDKGQFHYHLDRLLDHFVRRVEAGYELTAAGRTVVRSVIANPGLRETALDPTAVDRSCPHCGAGTTLSYENQSLRQVCPDCPGTVAGRDDLPRGTVSVWPLDGAGLLDRSPEELFAAGTLVTMRDHALMLGGVCSVCSGVVEGSLDVCEAHETGATGLCPTCERRYAVQARTACTVCKNVMWGPASIFLAAHPSVIAFFVTHGIDLGFVCSDPAGCSRYLDLVREHDDADVVSTDPRRVRVTFSCADDDLHLTIDADLSVRAVEVDGPAEPSLG